MQIHTLDKARLITDVQLGENLSQAITQGRRRDFALMLALLSSDATETTPLNPPYPKQPTEADLRLAFNLPEPTRLTAEEKDYKLCSAQANAFQQGGISSAKLCYYVSPSALYFPAIGTHNLGEEVYHNLSGHLRRKLSDKNPQTTVFNKVNLYQQLIASKLHLSA